MLERYPPAILDSIGIASPDAAARLQIAKFPAEPVALRVLRFHGPWASAERLAAVVTGFDIINVGHDRGLHEPRRIRGAVLVSPGEEGNRIGMLELAIARTVAGRPRVAHFTNTFRLFTYASDPDDPLVRQRIEEYRAALRVPTEPDERPPLKRVRFLMAPDRRLPYTVGRGHAPVP